MKHTLILLKASPDSQSLYRVNLGCLLYYLQPQSAKLEKSQSWIYVKKRREVEFELSMKTSVRSQNPDEKVQLKSPSLHKSIIEHTIRDMALDQLLYGN